MTNADAAALLGIGEDEVVDTFDTPAGPAIKTSDGQTYVDVPAGSPDAEGKTGVMFLVAPSESYGGTFPVYAAPAALTGEDDEDTVPTGSAAAVLAWVGDDTERAQRALEAEHERDKPRSTLVGHLESVIGAE